MASLLDEVKIDLWDKIRTKLSGSTFTYHKSGNPPKPWLIITQLLMYVCYRSKQTCATP